MCRDERREKEEGERKHVRILIKKVECERFGNGKCRLFCKENKKKGCKNVLEVKARCGEKKLERENNIPKNVV